MSVFNRVKRFLSLVVVVCFTVTSLQPPSAYAIQQETTGTKEERIKKYKAHVRALEAKQREIGLRGDQRKLLKVTSVETPEKIIPVDFRPTSKVKAASLGEEITYSDPEVQELVGAFRELEKELLVNIEGISEEIFTGGVYVQGTGEDKRFIKLMDPDHAERLKKLLRKLDKKYQELIRRAKYYRKNINEDSLLNKTLNRYERRYADLKSALSYLRQTYDKVAEQRAKREGEDEEFTELMSRAPPYIKDILKTVRGRDAVRVEVQAEVGNLTQRREENVSKRESIDRLINDDRKIITFMFGEVLPEKREARRKELQEEIEEVLTRLQNLQKARKELSREFLLLEAEWSVLADRLDQLELTTQFSIGENIARLAGHLDSFESLLYETVFLSEGGEEEKRDLLLRTIPRAFSIEESEIASEFSENYLGRIRNEGTFDIELHGVKRGYLSELLINEAAARSIVSSVVTSELGSLKRRTSWAFQLAVFAGVAVFLFMAISLYRLFPRDGPIEIALEPDRGKAPDALVVRPEDGVRPEIAVVDEVPPTDEIPEPEDIKPEPVVEEEPIKPEPEEAEPVAAEIPEPEEEPKAAGPFDEKEIDLEKMLGDLIEDIGEIDIEALPKEEEIPEEDLYGEPDLELNEKQEKLKALLKERDHLDEQINEQMTTPDFEEKLADLRKIGETRPPKAEERPPERPDTWNSVAPGRVIEPGKTTEGPEIKPDEDLVRPDREVSKEEINLAGELTSRTVGLGDGNIGGGSWMADISIRGEHASESSVSSFDFITGVSQPNTPDLKPWPLESTGDGEGHLIVRSMKDRAIRLLIPPGMVVLRIESEKRGDAAISFDEANQAWYFKAEKGQDLGLIKVIFRKANPGERGEFRPIRMTDAERDKYRSSVPPVLVEIIKIIKKRSEEERIEFVRNFIRRLMAYSTNPELDNIIRSNDGNILKSLFKIYAAECEGLSLLQAYLFSELGIDVNITYGYLDANSDGTISSDEGHAWNERPGGIVEESTQYAAHFLKDRAGRVFSVDDFAKEMGLLRDRAPVMQRELEKMLLELKVGEMEEEIDRAQYDKLTDKFDEHQRYYAELTARYDENLSKLDSIEKLIQTARTSNRVLMKDLNNRYQLMARGHYLLSALEKLKERADEMPGDLARTREVLTEAQQKLYLKILDIGNAKHWELNEPFARSDENDSHFLRGIRYARAYDSEDQLTIWPNDWIYQRVRVGPDRTTGEVIDALTGEKISIGEGKVVDYYQGIFVVESPSGSGIYKLLGERAGDEQNIAYDRIVLYPSDNFDSDWLAHVYDVASSDLRFIGPRAKKLGIDNIRFGNLVDFRQGADESFFMFAEGVRIGNKPEKSRQYISRLGPEKKPLEEGLRILSLARDGSYMAWSNEQRELVVWSRSQNKKTTYSNTVGKQTPDFRCLRDDGSYVVGVVDEKGEGKVVMWSAERNKYEEWSLGKRLPEELRFSDDGMSWAALVNPSTAKPSVINWSEKKGLLTSFMSFPKLAAGYERYEKRYSKLYVPSGDVWFVTHSDGLKYWLKGESHGQIFDFPLGENFDPSQRFKVVQDGSFIVAKEDDENIGKLELYIWDARKKKADQYRGLEDVLKVDMSNDGSWGAIIQQKDTNVYLYGYSSSKPPEESTIMTPPDKEVGKMFGFDSFGSWYTYYADSEEVGDKGDWVVMGWSKLRNTLFKSKIESTVWWEAGYTTRDFDHHKIDGPIEYSFQERVEGRFSFPVSDSGIPDYRFDLRWRYLDNLAKVDRRSADLYLYQLLIQMGEYESMPYFSPDEAAEIIKRNKDLFSEQYRDELIILLKLLTYTPHENLILDLLLSMDDEKARTLYEQLPFSNEKWEELAESYSRELKEKINTDIEFINPLYVGVTHIEASMKVNRYIADQLIREKGELAPALLEYLDAIEKLAMWFNQSPNFRYDRLEEVDYENTSKLFRVERERLKELDIEGLQLLYEYILKGSDKEYLILDILLSLDRTKRDYLMTELELPMEQIVKDHREALKANYAQEIEGLSDNVDYEKGAVKIDVVDPLSASKADWEGMLKLNEIFRAQLEGEYQKAFKNYLDNLKAVSVFLEENPEMEISVEESVTEWDKEKLANLLISNENWLDSVLEHDAGTIRLLIEHVLLESSHENLIIKILVNMAPADADSVYGNLPITREKWKRLAEDYQRELRDPAEDDFAVYIGFIDLVQVDSADLESSQKINRFILDEVYQRGHHKKATKLLEDFLTFNEELKEMTNKSALNDEDIKQLRTFQKEVKGSFPLTQAQIDRLIKFSSMVMDIKFLEIKYRYIRYLKKPYRNRFEEKYLPIDRTRAILEHTSIELDQITQNQPHYLDAFERFARLVHAHPEMKPDVLPTSFEFTERLLRYNIEKFYLLDTQTLKVFYDEILRVRTKHDKEWWIVDILIHLDPDKSNELFKKLNIPHNKLVELIGRFYGADINYRFGTFLDPFDAKLDVPQDDWDKIMKLNKFVIDVCFDNEIKRGLWFTKTDKERTQNTFDSLSLLVAFLKQHPDLYPKQTFFSIAPRLKAQENVLRAANVEGEFIERNSDLADLLELDVDTLEVLIKYSLLESPAEYLIVNILAKLDPDKADEIIERLDFETDVLQTIESKGYTRLSESDVYKRLISQYRAHLKEKYKDTFAPTLIIPFDFIDEDQVKINELNEYLISFQGKAEREVLNDYFREIDNLKKLSDRHPKLMGREKKPLRGEDLKEAFLYLGEFYGNLWHLDAEYQQSARPEGLWNIIRHNPSWLKVNLDPRDTFETRDLFIEFKKHNQKINEILGSDFEGELDEGSFFRDATSDISTFIALLTILSFIASFAADKLLKKDRVLLGVTAKKMMDRLWQENPWLTGRRAKQAREFMEAIVQNPEKGLIPEQKKWLEDRRGDYSPRERAILNLAATLPLEVPDKAKRTVFERVLFSAPIINLIVFAAGKRAYRQRQRLNRDLLNLFNQINNTIKTPEELNRGMVELIKQHSAVSEEEEGKGVSEQTYPPFSELKAAINRFYEDMILKIKTPTLRFLKTDGAPSKKLGSGGEYEASRRYVEGDDLRRIDWHAAARTEKLYTRQITDTVEIPGAIMIDLTNILGLGINAWAEELVKSILIFRRKNSGVTLKNAILILPDKDNPNKKQAFTHRLIGQDEARQYGTIMKFLESAYKQVEGVGISEGEDVELKFYEEEEQERWAERTKGVFMPEKTTPSELVKEMIGKGLVRKGLLKQLQVVFSGVSEVERKPFAFEFARERATSYFWDGRSARPISIPKPKKPEDLSKVAVTGASLGVTGELSRLLAAYDETSVEQKKRLLAEKHRDLTENDTQNFKYALGKKTSAALWEFFDNLLPLEITEKLTWQGFDKEWDRYDHIQKISLVLDKIQKGNENVFKDQKLEDSRPIFDLFKDLTENNPETLELLRIYFILHDYGYIVHRWHYEPGADLAKELLSKLGYDERKTQIISQLILYHAQPFNLYINDKKERDRGFFQDMKKVSQELFDGDETQFGNFLKILTFFSAVDVTYAGNRLLTDEPAPSAEKARFQNINLTDLLKFPDRVLIEIKAESLGAEIDVRILNNLKVPVNVYIDARDLVNFSRAQFDEVYNRAARNPEVLEVIVFNSEGYEKHPLLNLPNIIFTPTAEEGLAREVRKVDHNIHLSRKIDPKGDRFDNFRYTDDKNGLLGVALLYTQAKDQGAFILLYGLQKVGEYFSIVQEALLKAIRIQEAHLVTARAA